MNDKKVFWIKFTPSFYWGSFATLFFISVFVLTFNCPFDPPPEGLIELRFAAILFACAYVFASLMPQKYRASLLLLFAVMHLSLLGFDRSFEWVLAKVNEIVPPTIKRPPPPPEPDVNQYDVVLSERAKGLNAYPYIYHSEITYDKDFYRPEIAQFCDSADANYSKEKCHQFKPFPLSSFSNARIVLCIPRGYENYLKGDKWAKYDTDSLGFNNPDSVYRERQKIFVIGDSFVHGTCVNEGDDLSARLRARGWPAINLGEGGNGPMIEYARLKEYAPVFKPSLVLWVYTDSNDLDNLIAERKSSILRAYWERKDFRQDLIERQDEVNEYLNLSGKDLPNQRKKNAEWWKPYSEPAEWITFPKLTTAVLDFWGKKGQFWYNAAYEAARERVLGPRPVASGSKSASQSSLASSNVPVSSEMSPEEITELVDQLGEILVRSRELTESWGGKFVFVALQDYLVSLNVQPEDGSPWPSRRKWPVKAARDQVLAKVRSLGIPIVDFGNVINADKDPKRFFEGRGFGHYTVWGYDQLAEYITRRVPFERDPRLTAKSGNL